MQSTKDKIFCPLPFIQIGTNTGGDIQICCVAKPFSFNLGTNSLEEIWNSQEYQEVRNKFLNGEWPTTCSSCKIREEKTGISRRANMCKNWEKLDVKLSSQMSIDSIKSMDTRFGNLCNLKCRMCIPVHSSLISKEEQLEESFNLNLNKWLNSDKTYDNIKKIIPTLEYLKIEGAEPSINSTAFKVLNMIIDQNLNSKITIDITTNLTNANFQNILKEFNKVELLVSIDGYEKINDYIRYPSKWNTIVKNLNIYSNMPNVKIKINHTVQLSNIIHVADFIDWYQKNYFNKNNVILFLHILKNPYFLACNHLPENLKKITLEKLLKLENKLIVTNIKPLLKMLMFKENQEIHDANWSQFISYTKKLDARRNQNILDVVPEFSSYFK